MIYEGVFKMIYDKYKKFRIKEDVEYYMNKYRNRKSTYNKICTIFKLVYVDNVILIFPCSKCRYCEMNAVEGMSARYLR